MAPSELTVNLVLWVKYGGWDWWPAAIENWVEAELKLEDKEELPTKSNDNVMIRFFGSGDWGGYHAVVSSKEMKDFFLHFNRHVTFHQVEVRKAVQKAVYFIHRFGVQAQKEALNTRSVRSMLKRFKINPESPESGSNNEIEVINLISDEECGRRKKNCIVEETVIDGDDGESQPIGSSLDDVPISGLKEARKRNIGNLGVGVKRGAEIVKQGKVKQWKSKAKPASAKPKNTKVADPRNGAANPSKRSCPVAKQPSLVLKRLRKADSKGPEKKRPCAGGHSIIILRERPMEVIGWLISVRCDDMNYYDARVIDCVPESGLYTICFYENYKISFDILLTSAKWKRKIERDVGLVGCKIVLKRYELGQDRAAIVLGELPKLKRYTVILLHNHEIVDLDLKTYDYDVVHPASKVASFRTQKKDTQEGEKSEMMTQIRKLRGSLSRKELRYQQSNMQPKKVIAESAVGCAPSNIGKPGTAARMVRASMEKSKFLSTPPLPKMNDKIMKTKQLSGNRKMVDTESRTTILIENKAEWKDISSATEQGPGKETLTNLKQEQEAELSKLATHRTYCFDLDNELVPTPVSIAISNSRERPCCDMNSRIIYFREIIRQLLPKTVLAVNIIPELQNSMKPMEVQLRLLLECRNEAGDCKQCKGEIFERKVPVKALEHFNERICDAKKGLLRRCEKLRLLCSCPACVVCLQNLPVARDWLHVIDLARCFLRADLDGIRLRADSGLCDMHDIERENRILVTLRKLTEDFENQIELLEGALKAIEQEQSEVDYKAAILQICEQHLLICKQCLQERRSGNKNMANAN